MKKYIGTSWKMNMTIEESIGYVNALIKELANLSSSTFPVVSDNEQIFIIPPFTSLYSVGNILKNSPIKPLIKLGAQNVHHEEKGAFTGEISALMLQNLGVEIVEIGHSERRQNFNETDRILNKKIKTILKYKMIPLLCYGEPLYIKEAGASDEYLALQVKVALHDIPSKEARNIILAYEPIWAIGDGGIPAAPSYVKERIAGTRDVLKHIWKNQAEETGILYGGSVNLSNAKKFIDKAHSNGIFIGRSAWDVKGFIEIIKDIVSRGARPHAGGQFRQD